MLIPMLMQHSIFQQMFMSHVYLSPPFFFLLLVKCCYPIDWFFSQITYSFFVCPVLSIVGIQTLRSSFLFFTRSTHCCFIWQQISFHLSCASMMKLLMVNSCYFVCFWEHRIGIGLIAIWGRDDSLDCVGRAAGYVLLGGYCATLSPCLNVLFQRLTVSLLLSPSAPVWTSLLCLPQILVYFFCYILIL